MASGIGGLITILEQYDVLRTRGARRVSPFTVPMIMPNGAVATVALELDARAGAHSPASACASGSEAVAQGLELIRSGRADVVVCGGAEAVVHPLPMAAFAAMRALSTRHDEPQAASRPFDKQRDGFVLGEGAAILVLEAREHADARGADGLRRARRRRHGERRAPHRGARPGRRRRRAGDDGRAPSTPTSPRATSGTSTPTPRPPRPATSPRRSPCSGRSAPTPTRSP